MPQQRNQLLVERLRESNRMRRPRPLDPLLRHNQRPNPARYASKQQLDHKSKRAERGDRASRLLDRRRRVQASDRHRSQAKQVASGRQRALYQSAQVQNTKQSPKRVAASQLHQLLQVARSQQLLCQEQPLVLLLLDVFVQQKHCILVRAQSARALRRAFEPETERQDHNSLSRFIEQFKSKLSFTPQYGPAHRCAHFFARLFVPPLVFGYICDIQEEIQNENAAFARHSVLEANQLEPRRTQQQ